MAYGNVPFGIGAYGGGILLSTPSAIQGIATVTIYADKASVQSYASNASSVIYVQLASATLYAASASNVLTAPNAQIINT